MQQLYAGVAQAQGAQPSFWEQMVPILIIFIVMYFILVRPQVKKTREHADFLSKLKVGDEVLTSGGIIGRVKGIAETFVTVDTGSAHLKIQRDHIAQLTTKAAPASDKRKK